MNYEVETPWGKTLVITISEPVSEIAFDLAPPELRELVEPHFGIEHNMWITKSLFGLERIECCGEVLFDSGRIIPRSDDEEKANG